MGREKEAGDTGTPLICSNLLYIHNHSENKILIKNMLEFKNNSIYILLFVIILAQTTITKTIE